MENIRYAGLFRRIMAWSIDLIIIMVFPIMLLYIIETGNNFTLAIYIAKILLLSLNIFLLASSVFLVKSQFKLWNELQISPFYRIFNAIIMMLIFVSLFFVVITTLLIYMDYMDINNLYLNEFISQNADLSLVVFYYFCYVPLREGSEKQGSFGYQVMGIKIIDKDNKKIAFTHSLARVIILWLGSVLCLIHIISFFTILCTKEKKGIHDMFTKTRVIRN